MDRLLEKQKGVSSGDKSLMRNFHVCFFILYLCIVTTFQRNKTSIRLSALIRFEWHIFLSIAYLLFRVYTQIYFIFFSWEENLSIHILYHGFVILHGRQLGRAERLRRRDGQFGRRRRGRHSSPRQRRPRIPFRAATAPSQGQTPIFQPRQQRQQP